MGNVKNQQVEDIDNIEDFKKYYKYADEFYIYVMFSIEKTYKIHSAWVKIDRLEMKKCLDSIPDSAPLSGFFKYDKDSKIGGIYITPIR